MDKVGLIIPIVLILFILHYRNNNFVFFKGIWISEMFQENNDYFYYHLIFGNSSDIVKVKKISDHYCIEEFEAEFKSSIQKRVIYFFHQEQKFRLKYFHNDIIKLKHGGKRIRFVRGKIEKH